MAKSTNEERKQRVLDAASDLFVHFGYDKTTVSDIAKEAGVSKGAIYLHFDSKDDLFEALLLREMQAYGEQWLKLIDEDPRGGTIAGMYKNMLLALSSSTFMSILFKRDGRVLGNYMRKPDTILRYSQHRSTRSEFVQMMQDAGAIRKELDPKVTAHIMNMLSYGLVAMEDIMPRAEIPPTEAIIEGIADMMDRALTPEDGGNNEAGKAIIQKIAEASRQRFEQMKDPMEGGPAS